MDDVDAILQECRNVPGVCNAILNNTPAEFYMSFFIKQPYDDDIFDQIFDDRTLEQVKGAELAAAWRDTLDNRLANMETPITLPFRDKELPLEFTRVEVGDCDWEDYDANCYGWVYFKSPLELRLAAVGDQDRFKELLNDAIMKMPMDQLMNPVLDHRTRVDNYWGNENTPSSLRLSVYLDDEYIEGPNDAASIEIGGFEE